jgi:hypothetical protein
MTKPQTTSAKLSLRKPGELSMFMYCCQLEVQHVTYKNLAAALRVSNGTIHNILQDDQGLIKEWFFHWNKAFVHIAFYCSDVDGHQKDLIVLAFPYSLNLTPADYLLFQRVKEELARICLFQGSLTKT